MCKRGSDDMKTSPAPPDLPGKRKAHTKRCKALSINSLPKHGVASLAKGDAKCVASILHVYTLLLFNTNPHVVDCNDSLYSARHEFPRGAAARCASRLGLAQGSRHSLPPLQLSDSNVTVASQSRHNHVTVTPQSRHGETQTKIKLLLSIVKRQDTGYNFLLLQKT